MDDYEGFWIKGEDSGIEGWEETGSGDGYGLGYGNGLGNGSGSGDGCGFGYGDGYGNGWSFPVSEYQYRGLRLGGLL
jgi:hypothetical protein